MNPKPQGRGSQFAREARIGLTIIAVLITVFVWFTYRRFSSKGESVADLRGEASQRHVTGSDQSAGTPDNPYGRTEITNRDPRRNLAVPAQTGRLAPQAHGDNPAQSRPFPQDLGDSSTTAPAQGNPAHSNPANNQSPPSNASSFYDRGSFTVNQGKTSPPNVTGTGNDIGPRANTSPNRKPKKTTDSSKDTFEEPVIELGQEASLDELETPNSSPQYTANSAQQLNATNPIVKIEQSDVAVQPTETPENFATIPNSVEPDRGHASTQMPAARKANTTGIRAEMVSTTQNKTQTFFVEKNDTYWSISQRAYGTGHYYKALYEYNKGHVTNPDKLPVGQKIVAPPKETLKSKYPQLIKQKDSVSQTSYEQSGSAPPFQPQLADEPQPSQKPLPRIIESSEPELPSPTTEDFIPQVDAQPDLRQPKQFIPPVEPAAEPSTANDSAESIQPMVEINSAALSSQDENPASHPANVYSVREGENLFDIARNELLQASRYLEILECNREHLPADCTHLTPLPAGLKLKLPDQ